MIYELKNLLSLLQLLKPTRYIVFEFVPTDFVPPTADLRFTDITFTRLAASYVAVGWAYGLGATEDVSGDAIVNCRMCGNTKFYFNMLKKRFWCLWG